MYLYSYVPLIFQFCIGAAGFLITQARTLSHVTPYLNVILDPRLDYSDLRAPIWIFNWKTEEGCETLSQLLLGISGNV